MLILDDTMLTKAGLGFAEALALLVPPAEELIVHICRVMDGPPQPRPAAGHPTAPADPPGISLPVIPSCATDSQSESAVVVGQGEPEQVLDDVRLGGVEPAADGWPIGHRLRESHTAHPMPEDRGFNFTALADMARDRRMTLTYVGGVYTLIGAFKMMHFHSLAQVHDAMKHNRYD